IFFDRVQLAATELFLEEKLELALVLIVDLNDAFASVRCTHFKVILPATAVSATALIGTSLGHVVREQAASGIGHANGAVNKRLDPNIRTTLPDLRKLRKRYLARHHAQGSPLPLPVVDGEPRADVGLSGQMSLDLGSLVLEVLKHTGITDDYPIGLELTQRLDEARQLLNVAVVREQIEGEVDALTRLMSQPNALL